MTRWSSSRAWWLLVFPLLLASCSAGATESTTTTPSCEAFVDRWAEAVDTAGQLHLDALELGDQWDSGDLSQEVLVAALEEIHLQYFSLIESSQYLVSPPPGMERTSELLRDAISNLFRGYGNGYLALDGEVDLEQAELSDEQVLQGVRLLNEAVEAGQIDVCEAP